MESIVNLITYPSDIKSHGLYIFSNYVVGYSYTVAWGLSFLGQIVLNFQLKQVEGCNLDFVVYNLSGFIFYAIYNNGEYICEQDSLKSLPSICAGKNDYGVEVNDLVFANWALLMCIITFVQCFWIYPRYSNKVSMLAIVASILYWIFNIFWFCYILIDNGPSWYKEMSNQNYVSVFSMLGYFKMWISLTKYVPQAYWNYKRKSTVGWSIVNILLDLTGGLLSMLQIVLNSVNGSISTFSGGLNVTKFGLSVISIFFDILFMFQHYYLYNPKRYQNEIDNVRREELGNEFYENEKKGQEPLIYAN